MTDMDCQELVAVITDYLEGAMADDDRVRFDAHLAECPFCTSYVEQMRATIARLGALPDDPLPPAVRSDALAAFRDWRA